MTESIAGTLGIGGFSTNEHPYLTASAGNSCEWYVVHTSANHEKSVAAQLRQRAVEHFLPLYDTVHRWKDRRVRLQLPLFPGYVFVRLALCDRLLVLQVAGVARLVGFRGIPCSVPDPQIEAIQMCLAQKLDLEPYPYLELGRHVRIKAGPLEGLEGVVVGKKNRLRFLISLDLIHGSAAVKVEAADIQPI